MKTIWVKNKRTGLLWEVSEARAADLLRESDDEGMVYEETKAPAPGPKSDK